MNDKRVLAENWMDSYNLYGECYSQFVEAFGLNALQCFALRKVCDLAEGYARSDAKARDAGLTFDEILAICKQVTAND